MIKAKKEEKKEPEKEKKKKTVTLFDVNENACKFPAEREEELLKQGYRKSL